MSKAREFIEKLSQVFTSRDVSGCLEKSNETRIQIREVEPAGPVCIVEVSQSAPCFQIRNPQSKDIYVLATDNCFFHSQDGKRCDCIVFDNACLCFTELKLEVESHRQATTKAKDAREQLGATIHFFRVALGKSLSDFKLEAYIVMRHTVRPAQRAQRISVFVEFLKTYGVPLTELSDKEYKEF